MTCNDLGGHPGTDARARPIRRSPACWPRRLRWCVLTSPAPAPHQRISGAGEVNTQGCDGLVELERLCQDVLPAVGQAGDCCRAWCADTLFWGVVIGACHSPICSAFCPDFVALIPKTVIMSWLHGTLKDCGYEYSRFHKTCRLSFSLSYTVSEFNVEKLINPLSYGCLLPSSQSENPRIYLVNS